MRHQPSHPDYGLARRTSGTLRAITFWIRWSHLTGHRTAVLMVRYCHSLRSGNPLLTGIILPNGLPRLNKPLRFLEPTLILAFVTLVPMSSSVPSTKIAYREASESLAGAWSSFFNGFLSDLSWSVSLLCALGICTLSLRAHAGDYACLSPVEGANIGIRLAS